MKILRTVAKRQGTCYKATYKNVNVVQGIGETASIDDAVRPVQDERKESLP